MRNAQELETLSSAAAADFEQLRQSDRMKVRQSYGFAQSRLAGDRDGARSGTGRSRKYCAYRDYLSKVQIALSEQCHPVIDDDVDCVTSGA